MAEATTSIDARVRLSLDAWMRLPEDEPGELVDGHLEEEEMADAVHDLVVGWIIEVLRRWLRPRRAFVGASDTKFAVGHEGGRKPDVWVYLPGGRVPPRRGPISVPPDIMVEVVSPTPKDSRRDRVTKMDEYARFGVRYYWIVDPELRTLEIWERLDDGRYARSAAATAGAMPSVPGCEGLVIDLDELWAEVDALGPAEPTSTP